MPFEPGQSGNPAGKPKGSLNKATSDARAAIAAFVDSNAERLNSLLDRIQEDDPKAAFDCIMSVCEYHIPKLARSEHTGKDGKDLFPERLKVELVRNPNSSDTGSV